MAMRWLVHSVCAAAFGYNPKDDDLTAKTVRGYPIGETLLKEDNACCKGKSEYPITFQMPLHYPRYNKEDYEKMDEWKVDMLLREYGMTYKGTLDEKRAFAMGAFLWPDQY